MTGAGGISMASEDRTRHRLHRRRTRTLVRAIGVTGMQSSFSGTTEIQKESSPATSACSLDQAFYETPAPDS
jgi:hypothetical protein